MRIALFTILIWVSHCFAAERGLTIQYMASESRNASVAGEMQLYSKSYALVIGIDDYAGGWPRLSQAVNDAENVASVLEDKGFDVTLLKNLDSNALEDAFEDFFIDKGADPESRLFVWFAGHGHTVNGEGYLIPSDGVLESDRRNFLRRSMSLRDFGKFSRLAESKHVYTVFDACFAGTIFNVARSAPPPAITRITSQPVRQFLSAGDAGQTVSDDGTFARMFVEALKGERRSDLNNDGYLTAGELGSFMTDKISNYTRNKQVPRQGKLSDPNFDRGDFVFFLNTSMTNMDVDHTSNKPIVKQAETQPTSVALMQPSPAMSNPNGNADRPEYKYEWQKSNEKEWSVTRTNNFNSRREIMRNEGSWRGDDMLVYLQDNRRYVMLPNFKLQPTTVSRFISLYPIASDYLWERTQGTSYRVYYRGVNEHGKDNLKSHWNGEDLIVYVKDKRQYLVFEDFKTAPSLNLRAPILLREKADMVWIRTEGTKYRLLFQGNSLIKDNNTRAQWHGNDMLVYIKNRQQYVQFDEFKVVREGVLVPAKIIADSNDLVWLRTDDSKYKLYSRGETLHSDGNTTSEWRGDDLIVRIKDLQRTVTLEGFKNAKEDVLMAVH